MVNVALTRPFLYSPLPLGGSNCPKMAVPPEVEARVGAPKEIEGLSDDDLKAVLKEYYDK